MLDLLTLTQLAGFPLTLEAESGPDNPNRHLVSRLWLHCPRADYPHLDCYVYCAITVSEWKGRTRYHVEGQSELQDDERSQFNIVEAHDTLAEAVETACAFWSAALPLVLWSLWGAAQVTPGDRSWSAMERAWDGSGEPQAGIAAEGEGDEGETGWMPCPWDGRRYLSSRLAARWREFGRGWRREHNWRAFV